MARTSKEAWTIGGIATVVALVASVWSLWPSFGWMTPAGHAADLQTVEADHEVVNEQILDAIKDLGLQQQEGRDEWKCDEYDEELLDLLRAQVEADTPELQHEISKIREKMRQLRCDRFEDFG